MTEAAPRHWTTEEFFVWQELQPDRYELVDGFPLRMMAGARNVLTDLRNQLRGGACRPFTGDGSIETKPGQIRRPDIGASTPRVVLEVLSPTTRDFDTIGKLEEYKLVDSLERIVVIEPNAPEVIVWERSADRTWRSKL
jgi:Uma2 family endonuclease